MQTHHHVVFDAYCTEWSGRCTLFSHPSSWIIKKWWTSCRQPGTAPALRSICALGGAMFPSLCAHLACLPYSQMDMPTRRTGACSTSNRRGGTRQTEDDVVGLLRAIRAARGRPRTVLVQTLARRHGVYPFPHCLSADDDRYGSVPRYFVVPVRVPHDNGSE